MVTRNIIMSVLVFFLVVIAMGKVYSMKGPTVDSLPEGYSFGLNRGLLAPCRDRPNCVCTDHRDDHYMEPVKINAEKWASFKEDPLIPGGCRLIVSEENYMRFECESAFFRFIDDVELLYDESSDLLRFRSAARLGYSDLGVNMKRMEGLISFLTRVD